MLFQPFTSSPFLLKIMSNHVYDEQVLGLFILSVICPLIKKRIMKDVINMQEMKLSTSKWRINKRKIGKYRINLEKISPVNPQVVGSSPTGGAKKTPSVWMVFFIISMVRCDRPAE